MIGERLAELRKGKHLTQQQLAEQLSISIHTVKSYEQEKTEPDDATKVKICEFFNVTADFLLGLVRDDSPLNREYYFPIDKRLPKEAVKEIQKYHEYLVYKYKVK